MRRSIAERLGLPALAALVSLASCRGEASNSTGAAAAPSRAASAAPAPAAKGPLTTDGAIAIGNLEAQIRSAEKIAAERPHDPDFIGRAVGLLLDRASFVGSVADLERAAGLAEAAVTAAPGSPRAHLLRARARSAFHRFQEALADIEQARELGALPGDIDPARAAALEGLGRYDEARTLRRAARERARTITTLGAEASLLGEMGRITEAEPLFDEAISVFRDVSPFPVAWIEFQRGLLWERAGDLARARALFEQAHRRLPAFAHAAAHLALLEPPSRGISILRPVAQSSDDPEHAALLARLLSLEGEPGAAELLEGARSRFDALAQKYPLAFADHAGRFWLGAGKAPEKAFALAKQNLDARQTPAAYELFLSAAVELRKGDVACEAAERAESLPYPTIALHEAAARAFTLCGKADRAERAKRAAKDAAALSSCSNAYP